MHVILKKMTGWGEQWAQYWQQSGHKNKCLEMMQIQLLNWSCDFYLTNLHLLASFHGICCYAQPLLPILWRTALPTWSLSSRLRAWSMVISVTFWTCPMHVCTAVLLLHYTLTSIIPHNFTTAPAKKTPTKCANHMPATCTESIHTVLIWRESSSINIDVWINLDRRDS